LVRTASKIAAIIAAGAMLGVIATWLTVVRGDLPENIANGPWKTSLATGSAQSDPYTRAYTALHGLFAMDRTEALYFVARTDSSGQPLDGACRYRIVGRDPSARWWSITAYGADDYLIPNPMQRYAVTASAIARQADGSFVVQIGGTGGGSNWIAAGNGRFSLTLRLYNPGPDVTLDPGNAALPLIAKIDCP
jgi:hypothetical protein